MPGLYNLNPTRVEYPLHDVYQAVVADLARVYDYMASLKPDESSMFAVLRASQTRLSGIFEQVACWKSEGVSTLVTDRPFDDGRAMVNSPDSLAEQIRAGRLSLIRNDR